MRFKRLRVVVAVALVLFILMAGSIIVTGLFAKVKVPMTGSPQDAVYTDPKTIQPAPLPLPVEEPATPVPAPTPVVEPAPTPIEPTPVVTPPPPPLAPEPVPAPVVVHKTRRTSAS